MYWKSEPSVTVISVTDAHACRLEFLAARAYHLTLTDGSFNVYWLHAVAGTRPASDLETRFRRQVVNDLSSILWMIDVCLSNLQMQQTPRLRITKPRDHGIVQDRNPCPSLLFIRLFDLVTSVHLVLFGHLWTTGEGSAVLYQQLARIGFAFPYIRVPACWP